MGKAPVKAKPAPRRPRAPAPASRAPDPALRRVAATLRGGPGTGVQAKITVGAANDPAEHEADFIAERVATMGALPASVPAADSLPDDAPTARRGVRDQPDLDTLDARPPLPEAQKDVALPPEEDVQTETLGASEIAELESGSPEPPDAGSDQAGDADAADAADDTTPAPAADASAGVQAKRTAAVGPEGGPAPSHVSARIASPGPGRPLPAPVRAYMEPRFGADFSNVRIHDGPADRDTAATLGARAFAYGSDIWLGTGERAEDTRLMAHELTHVVQQTGRSKSRLMAPGGPAGPQRVQRGLFSYFRDKILSRVAKYARHVPGYTLLSVILGRDPITGKTVGRNAKNLLGGFLGLLPGGTLLFDRLRETGAIDTAFDWVKAQIGKLNLSLSRVDTAIGKARSLFSLRSPIASIKPAFKPLYDDIVAFLSSLKSKILEFIVRGALKLAGRHAEKVWGVLKGAGQTLGKILENPLAFAKNLFSAVSRGFGLFATNVVKHLKAGLLGFLFGALDGLNLQVPKTLDLKGIVSIVFQILGVTWTRIRKILVKRLKPRGERKVAFIEKAVDVLKVLVTKGILGVWQKMLGLIEGLKTTVIGGIRDFVMVSLVKGGLGWLAGLTNPAGAIAKIVLTIYNFIVAFLERMTQILDLVKSITGSIAAIAAGKIGAAAKKVEEAIGRSVPLVLAFLGAMIPVSGIASKVQSVFKKLRKPVDKAINALVAFLVKKAKKLMSKLLGKVNKARKAPKAAFRLGKARHSIFARRVGRTLQIFTRSQTTAAPASRAQIAAQAVQARQHLAGPALDAVLAALTALDEGLEISQQQAAATPATSTTASTKGPFDKLRKAIAQGDRTFEKYGLFHSGQHGFYLDTSQHDQLVRFRSPISDLEGESGTYSSVNGKLATQRTANGTASAHAARVLETDHNPPLAVIDRTRAFLQAHNPPKARTDRIFFKRSTPGPTSKVDFERSVFGSISTSSEKRPGPAHPAMAIYGPANSGMAPWDQSEGTQTQTALTALMTAAGASLMTSEDEIRAELGRRIDRKYDKIIGTYQALQPPDIAPGLYKKLVMRIKNAIRSMRKLTNAIVKVKTRTRGAPGSTTGIDKIERIKPLTGRSGSADAPDFTVVEGRTGLYGQVRDSSLKGYLEADHNPTENEMKKASTWTLGQVARADLLAAAQARQTYSDKKPGTRNTIDARIKALRQKKVGPRVGETYTQYSGGAAVISRAINQSREAKADDLATILGGTRSRLGTWPDGIALDALIDGLAKKPRTSVDTQADALAVDAADAINGSLKTRIEARQRIIEKQYRGRETTRIRDINKGLPNGPNLAAAQLAIIAQKIRAASATVALGKQIDRVFPEK